MAKANPTLQALADHAEQIRKEIRLPKKASELFELAVEAAYLAARADGEVDDTEREALVRAVEILSVGQVIEWETDALLERCTERAHAEGTNVRAAKVGTRLKELGHAEAAMLVAAVVARATRGVDKKEADVLKAVGAAAGLDKDAIKDIVKRAASIV